MKFLKLVQKFSVLVLFTCNLSYAQKSKTYNTRINKVNNVYVGSISDVQRNNVMLVSKYIRNDRPIKVSAGITITYNYESLKRGSTIYGGEPENIIKFKIVGNNLFINSLVKSIDQKVVAIIKDNRLLINKGLLQRSSQKYIEIIDDYGVPVLQVILSKDNSIEVNGVFFTETACYILNKGKLDIMGFKPFSRMNEHEKQEALYSIRKEAKSIRAID